MIASFISDFPDVKNIRDDVIIYGVNVQENDKALHSVLTRFLELKITLYKNKRQFYMHDLIYFFGMVFSAQRMSPDHANVEAIKQAALLTPEYRRIKCPPILDRGVHKLHKTRSWITVQLG